VLYDDGEIEQLNMAKEKWERIESNGSSKKVDCFNSFLEIISLTLSINVSLTIV
jgi:hypothetical protein